MASLGPRYAGSAADRAWVDHLALRMVEIGLQDITKTPVRVDGPNIQSPLGAVFGPTAHHLSGVLEGPPRSPVILIANNSDGVNAIQENANVAALAVVQHLARAPRECRHYTYAVAFTTCHMAECSSDEMGWEAENPQIMSRVAAIVSPEHLGHLDEAGNLIPYVLWSASATLRDTARGLLTEMGLAARAQVKPLGIGTAVQYWIGSGFKPTLGGMAEPVTSYFAGLLDPTRSGMGSLDSKMYWNLTVFYARLAGRLDQVSPADLGALIALPH